MQTLHVTNPQLYLLTGTQIRLDFRWGESLEFSCGSFRSLGTDEFARDLRLAGAA